MNAVLAAVVAAVACGLVAAYAMPRMVARLPEPEPWEPRTLEPGQSYTVAEQARIDEPPKQPYAAMGREPGFVWAVVLWAVPVGALLGYRIGLDWRLLLVLPPVAVGAALGVIDWRCRELPRQPVWAITVGALVYGVVAWPVSGSHEALLRGLIGMALAFGFFAVAWFVYPPGFGYGDVRMTGVLGFVLAYLGWTEFVVGLYSPFLLFGLPGLLNAVVRRDASRLKVAYPFGPALLVGAALGVLVGPALASALGY